MMKNCIKCKKAMCVDELSADCFKCKKERKMSEELHLSSTGSKRLNGGKPEVSQLDPRFIMDLADLITKSAQKYGKYNYALGQEYHTPYDSCMRHLMKFMAGEDIDSESGLSHLLHAAANIMILYTSVLKNNKDLDTRNKW